jgi:hypothetical protein
MATVRDPAICSTAGTCLGLLLAQSGQSGVALSPVRTTAHGSGLGKVLKFAQGGFEVICSSLRHYAGE